MQDDIPNSLDRLCSYVAPWPGSFGIPGSELFSPTLDRVDQSRVELDCDRKWLCSRPFYMLFVPPAWAPSVGSIPVWGLHRQGNLV